MKRIVNKRMLKYWGYFNFRQNYRFGDNVLCAVIMLSVSIDGHHELEENQMI